MSRSIDNEKAEVARLRGEGLTLQEIAHRLGKSIYWVNSRLDPKYEPKRIRRVAEDDREVPESQPPDDENLASEVIGIQRLRASGLTYEQIANKLNRSVYWVHTRLRDAYRPQGTRAEKLFQETRVVPFLQEAGHTDIRQYVRVEGNGYSQEADVVSVHDGKVNVTEVKLQATHHQIQTAIGQLILHRLALAETQQTVHVQIALPEETMRRKAPTTLIELLAKKESIHVIFVPKKT